MSLIMDLVPYTEEHRIFLQGLQKFPAREVVSHIEEWEEAGVVPRSAWKKMGEQGFVCIDVPAAAPVPPPVRICPVWGIKRRESKGKNMDELIEELKVKIISTLSLLDVQPEDINEDEPLVGGGIGIDSIDILELVLMLEKDYGVKIETREVGVEAFASLRALAGFVRENRTKR
jgi:acyl carrier protein